MGERGNEEWFDAGEEVCLQGASKPLLPPLNDMEAQRWWLAGFGVGWMESDSEEAAREVLFSRLEGYSELVLRLVALGAVWERGVQ